MTTAVPEGATRATATVRVASVPSSHVYVRHLAPVGDADGTRTPIVTRLDDPDPDDVRRSAVSRWWPPAMLEAEWVREHAGEFDVFHLQFGFDARSIEQLLDLVAALRESGKPLVYTVHDLRNPHHLDRAEHDAQLDVLIRAADALITLTPGAAAEIERRWGRTATVLPHPHVVDFDTMSAVQAARSGRAGADATAAFRVGVHVKSLRASMRPQPVIEALVQAARELPGVVVQVDGHADVMDSAGVRYDADLAVYLRSAADAGEIDLRIHDFFTDQELWGYLSSLDVSVLPYRFGTHSGWLEACHDLGTAVIAPDCGYYAEQAPVFVYHHDETELDADSLRRALGEAMEGHVSRPATVADRLRQREQIATAHLELYRAIGA